MADYKPWEINLAPVMNPNSNTLIEQRLLTDPFNQRLGQNGQVSKVDYNSLVNNYTFGVFLNLDSLGGGLGSCGFSAADGFYLTFGVQEGNTDKANLAAFTFASNVGSSPYLAGKSGLLAASILAGGANIHPLRIGADWWTANTIDTDVRKNGSAVTISGTNRFGPIGHDPGAAYLLVLYSTTKIARFSGISGTTITNTNSDITLDTAVTQTGFIYDSKYKQYICVDTTNNLVRKFNSVGQTVKKASYSADDAAVAGLALVGNRFYLVSIGTENFSDGSNVSISLLPTTMVRG
jgi:hypothetical protein